MGDCIKVAKNESKTHCHRPPSLLLVTKQNSACFQVKDHRKSIALKDKWVM